MTVYLVTTTYITQLNEPFILMLQSYFKFHYRCIKFMCKSANGMCKRLHVCAEQKKRPLAHSEQSHTIQIKTCKTLINLCVSSYI